jgi:hypothetical protein
VRSACGEEPGPILFGASGGAAGRRRGGGADEGLGVKRGKPATGGRSAFSTGIGESGMGGASIAGGFSDAREAG